MAEDQNLLQRGLCRKLISELNPRVQKQSCPCFTPDSTYVPRIRPIELLTRPARVMQNRGLTAPSPKQIGEQDRLPKER